MALSESQPTAEDIKRQTLELEGQLANVNKLLRQELAKPQYNQDIIDSLEKELAEELDKKPRNSSLINKLNTKLMKAKDCVDDETKERLFQQKGEIEEAIANLKKPLNFFKGNMGEEKAALTSLMHLNETKDGDWTIKSDIYNLDLILTQSQEFIDRPLRTNMMDSSIYCGNEKLENPDCWETTLQTKLCEIYDVEWSSDQIYRKVNEIAWRNRFDPFLDYIKTLTFSGTSSIPDLIQAMNLEPQIVTYTNSKQEIVSIDLNREFIMKWMMEMIDRLVNPGCQADSALVLIGTEGGESKTKFGRYMGYNDIKKENWAGEPILNLDGDLKNAIMAIHSHYIITVDEFDEIGRNPKLWNAWKKFSTINEDSFRAPYAHHNKVVPRRNVFIIPTNKPNVLAEEEGIRRIWPVVLQGPMDFEKIMAIRDNLWAEAYLFFHQVDANGKRVYLPYFEHEDQRAITRYCRRFKVQDHRDAIILEALDELYNAEKVKGYAPLDIRFRYLDIREACMRVDSKHLTREGDPIKKESTIFKGLKDSTLNDKLNSFGLVFKRKDGYDRWCITQRYIDNYANNMI